MPLAGQIREAANLIKTGQVASAADAIARLTDAASPLERDTLQRVEETLRRYAFPVARARLEHAATRFPDRAELIRACIPDTDPGIFHRDNETRQPAYRRDRAPRDSRRWVDPTRRVPAAQQHGEPDVVFDYTTGDIDHLIQPNPDDRTRHDEHLPDSSARLVDSDSPVGRRRMHWRDEPDRLDDFRTSRARRREHDPSREEHLQALLEPLRDLPCVGCGFERPLADRPAFDPVTGDTERDDGLCGDCRVEGGPGIPAHDADRYIEARCAYVAATRPAPEALAFLHRDWRRVALAHRHRIRTWVLEHGLRTQADQARAEATDPVRELPDAELSDRIEQTRRRIALAASMKAAETLPASPPITDPGAARSQGIAAADAITDARSAADTAADLSKQLHSIGRQIAATRTQLVSATSDTHHLESTLAALRQTKQQLITAVAASRRAAQDAHRDAELIAGPSEQWDEVLTHPGRFSPPQATAVTETHAGDDGHWQRQLDALRAEQRRRATLSPAERDSEQAHRRSSPRAPEPADVTHLGTTSEPTISAPTDELGR
ncbi:hypothetical protein [Nocardia sp. NPDC005745]|uniref:hypothetical protein n=1 Tax=Nocardia sp. NPDC005745 TaxID=3157061 RepID=UPI0033C6687B